MNLVIKKYCHLTFNSYPSLNSIYEVLGVHTATDLVARNINVIPTLLAITYADSNIAKTVEETYEQYVDRTFFRIYRNSVFYELRDANSSSLYIVPEEWIIHADYAVDKVNHVSMVIDCGIQTDITMLVNIKSQVADTVKALCLEKHKNHLGNLTRFSTPANVLDSQGYKVPPELITHIELYGHNYIRASEDIYVEGTLTHLKNEFFLDDLGDPIKKDWIHEGDPEDPLLDAEGGLLYVPEYLTGQIVTSDSVLFYPGSTDPIPTTAAEIVTDDQSPDFGFLVLSEVYGEYPAGTRILAWLDRYVTANTYTIVDGYFEYNPNLNLLGVPIPADGATLEQISAVVAQPRIELMAYKPSYIQLDELAELRQVRKSLIKAASGDAPDYFDRYISQCNENAYLAAENEELRNLIIEMNGE